MSGLTMGSLFDGIGGFPLAALRSGITPVWASEIEAFPIEVTKQRFPSMIHVGDITKLNGVELPPVDIICGGSPCQDLSVAGARAGLSGARSGLFMEQVRLVKEMRNADEQRGRTGHAVRPRYMLWENVPGAFSSGTPKGEDFRIVLEEIVRVKCGSVYVPGPYLLCVALLCGLLAGCGNDKVQEEQNDNVSADTIPEDVVVHTDYGDLHYPDRWQEYVTIRQEQNGNTIAVTFETKSGEETYELFKVLIGDDSSEVVGCLTDDTGAQRNVYLHVEELPADSGLEETEQTRFYAMQEDLNYLIDNLK